MNTTSLIHSKSGIQVLVQAIASKLDHDGLSSTLTPAQWDTLGNYMQAFVVEQGQVVINHGTQERNLYFVESGNLSVHFEDAKGRVRLAIVGPGSVVGEGGFFSHLPRSSTVQASTQCRLWCLSPMRFTELAGRQPTIALDLALSLGAVMARRVANRARRVAIT